ncbi:unnamed protein product [Echinostoma caproni]|uniref:PPM-type phosphatase domain-containing protein n=1 Tax=Echinostoma caproni TaxID=27848 RepID=A0A182ZZ73_9TREM|nr:unnamed protein product [Echinostoma caproni]
MLRMDDVLCSTNYEIDLHANPVPRSSSLPEDPTLARELLRVALSGAVGITGRIFWENTNHDSPVQLHMANVGDCGAVLLRLVDPLSEHSDSPLLEAIPCTRPHQGACNSDEINRVLSEHPDNTPSELFREGGRLLGELAMCRSFGNVRYKWPAKRVLELSKVLDRLSSSSADSGKGTTTSPIAVSGMRTRGANLFPMPTPYTSPPYLTAKPEVTRFESCDQRCIIVPNPEFHYPITLKKAHVNGVTQTHIDKYVHYRTNFVEQISVFRFGVCFKYLFNTGLRTSLVPTTQQ